MSVNLNGGASAVNIMKSPYATLATSGYSNNDQARLISCNQPLVYQINWGSTLPRITNTSLDSALQSGDVVNVLFDVYIGVDYQSSRTVNNSTGATNMVLAGTLRKSRDLPYKANEGINPQSATWDTTVNYHTFTVDIAPIVKNYLSYTLAPIKKGAMSADYQMGGHYSTNDIYPFTSIQGSSRFIDVQIRFEVKETSSGSNLVIANDGTNDVRKNTSSYPIINSVPQYTGWYGNLNLWRITGAYYATPRGKFLSLCPNGEGYVETPPYSAPKLVREDEEAEWLSYYLDSFTRTGSTLDSIDWYMRVTATNFDSSTNYVNIRDWQETVGATSPYVSGNFGTAPLNTPYQGKYIMQNVSPAYLNTLTNWTGTGITANTESYEAVLYSNDGSTTFKVSETRHYKIDRESANAAFPFVRFHWVNRMGGIDSYTAKRDTTEGVDVTKTFFERQTTDMRYIQQYDGGTFTTSQDPLGADTYKPSIETLGMTATEKGSVFTEPLNSVQAKWLEEIVTSPNVWIELQNAASERANTSNPTSHPSEKDYFPVIINNSTVSTVDESLGLVKFNIEYTHSHKLNTQSN